MPKFEHNGVCITVLPFPVTLKNHQAAKEWVDKVRVIAASEGVHQQQSKILQAIKTWPELLEFIDNRGLPNPVAIERYEGMIRRQQVKYWDEHKTPKKERVMPSDEEIRALAEEQVNQQIRNCVLSNQEIAKLLYFMDDAYPETATALLTGIEVIKATADRAKMDDETKALIDSALDSDFWQERTASEVAEYVNLFRERFK